MKRFSSALTVTAIGMMLSAGYASAATFSNTAPITIPSTGPTNAAPYPSSINVAGIPGPITDVNVKLNGYTHGFPDDVGAALVAPGGQALLLMDCVGDTTNAANLTFTFDDSAAMQAPNAGLLSTGSFKPANHCGNLDMFPAPGPGTAYGNPGPNPVGTATLASSFNGGIANGVWNLYVRDFVAMESGQFAGGWSLEIQPSPLVVTKKKKCKKKKKKRRAGTAKKKKCKKKKKG